MVLIPPGSVISSSGVINMMGGQLSEVNEESMGIFCCTLQEDNLERTPVRHTTRKLIEGSPSVLAIRILLINGEYNITDQTGLSNEIFGNGVDPTNLKSQYSACSHNQLNFEKAVDRVMMVDPKDNTTDIVYGMVYIKVELTMKANDYNIRDAVTKKIIHFWHHKTKSTCQSHHALHAYWDDD